jgi:hypothetical protein
MTPSALYASMNPLRHFDACRTCQRPFTARAGNALDCAVCRGLTERQKRQKRDAVRKGAAGETR